MNKYVNCPKCKARKAVWRGVTYDGSDYIHYDAEALPVIITEWMCTECDYWKARIDNYGSCIGQSIKI